MTDDNGYAKYVWILIRIKNENFILEQIFFQEYVGISVTE